jgi:hypothetical protein
VVLDYCSSSAIGPIEIRNRDVVCPQIHRQLCPMMNKTVNGLPHILLCDDRYPPPALRTGAATRQRQTEARFLCRSPQEGGVPGQ